MLGLRPRPRVVASEVSLPAPGAMVACWVAMWREGKKPAQIGDR